MRRLRAEIMSCASNSSAHGIPRLVTADRASLKTLWFLIYGTATLALLIHFSMLLHLYLQNTVTTSISYEAIPFEFPDVTVCAGSLYSVRLVQSYFRNKAMSQMNASEIDSMTEETLDSIAANFTLDEFYEKEDDFRFNVQTAILFCEYYGEPCDMQRISSMVYRRREMCYTYRPTNRRASPDIELGLILDIYAENVDNIYSIRMKDLGIPGTAYAGVRLVIHEPGCCPHASSEALAVTPGTTTEVILKIEKVIRLPVPKIDMTACTETKYNPVLYCADLSKPNSVLSFNATTRDCQIRRMQEIILEVCKCVSSAYPVPLDICRSGPGPGPGPKNSSSGLTFCPDYSDCVRKQLARVGRNYEEMVSKYCPNSCEQTTWYPKLGASITWGSVDIVDTFRYNIDSRHEDLVAKNQSSPFNQFINVSSSNYQYFTREFIELIVYPAAHAGNKIVEKLAYPLESFISEVGGILGLWIGSSVITFLEPLEIICKMIESLFHDQMDGKKRRNMHEDNSVSAVRNIRPTTCSYTSVTVYAAPPENNNNNSNNGVVSS